MSLIFSGNFVPLVSGRNNAKNEVKEQDEPITIIGRGFQIVVKISEENPTKAPRPPKNVAIPTAEFLIDVGYNSVVYNTIVFTEPVATARPSIEKVVCNHGNILKCIKIPVPMQQRPKVNSKSSKVAFRPILSGSSKLSKFPGIPANIANRKLM